jgi:hypothetical protein
MDVAHEVDKKADGEGLSIVITVGVFLNGVNHHVVGHVLTGEPALDGRKSERDVLLVVSKIEVGLCGLITDERNVIKVPVALPAPTASL